METLEQRKAKYRKHMENAVGFEEEKDLTNAYKEYSKALPYCLHKKDSDYLQKKIQDLKDKHQYVNSMQDSSSQGGNSKLFLFVGLGILLVIAIAAAVVLVLKPF